MLTRQPLLPLRRSATAELHLLCISPSAFALNKAFPYYGMMNVTLTLDDDLVKQVRRIAVEQDTTLSAMIRSYLEQVASEDATRGRRRRQRDALERSFERYKFRIGKRSWKRPDLYERA